MIKIVSMKLDPTTKTVEAELFSDTKGEVTSQAEIEGLPKDYTIAFGSSVMTASAEVAFMKSDGTWKWV